MKPERNATHLQRNHARKGHTLIEQMMVLTVIGIMAAIGTVGISRIIDSVRVHSAVREIADLFAVARDEATSTGHRTAVRVDSAAGRVIVHSGQDTIARYTAENGGDVVLRSSRDSMAYAPSGLGYGASNMSVVVRRGLSAETLTVSRLGRVRR